MKKTLGFVFLFLLLSVSLIAGPVFSSYLAPDVPNGTATVDGIISIGEWDIDPFAPMYEAGDDTKTHFSDLYLQYDCLTSTLYALVLDIPDDEFLPIDPLQEDDAWLKIVYDYSSPQGTNVYTTLFEVRQLIDETDTLIGYEASGMVNPPDGLDEDDYPATFNFQAHIQYYEVDNPDGATSSTGKPSFISMELNCEPPGQPIPEPGTMILLGFGLIGLAGIGRRKIKK